MWRASENFTLDHPLPHLVPNRFAARFLDECRCSGFFGPIGSALQVHPTRYAPPAYADPTPVAELAYTGPSEAEKAANWQRILEMRKATPTPATNQQYKRPPTTREMGMPLPESVGGPPTTQEMGMPDP
jgi:hypothetical protein